MSRPDLSPCTRKARRPRAGEVAGEVGVYRKALDFKKPTKILLEAGAAIAQTFHFDFEFLNWSMFFWILAMSSCCFAASFFPSFTSSRLVLINSLVSFAMFDIFGKVLEIIYWVNRWVVPQR